MTTVTETPSIPLREVRGPAAFGGEAKRFFQLLWLISKTELRTRYQGAAFGMAWAVVEPLLIFGVMYAVFSSVGRFGGTEPHYPAMLLMNIMLYRAIFAGSTGRATQAVVAREGLVRKTQFPRIIIPLSVVLTSMLLFTADAVVLLVFFFINGVPPMWTWLLFPVIVLSFLILTIGMSLLLSSLYVRHRDTAPVWSVISLMFFYGSPVIFPVNAVPSSLRSLLFFMNPFVPMLEQARIWMINPTAPPITSVVSGPVHGLLIPTLVYVGVCVLGAWYFIKRAPRVAEEMRPACSASRRSAWNRRARSSRGSPGSSRVRSAGEKEPARFRPTKTPCPGLAAQRRRCTSSWVSPSFRGHVKPSGRSVHARMPSPNGRGSTRANAEPRGRSSSRRTGPGEASPPPSSSSSTWRLSDRSHRRGPMKVASRNPPGLRMRWSSSIHSAQSSVMCVKTEIA